MFCYYTVKSSREYMKETAVLLTDFVGILTLKKGKYGMISYTRGQDLPNSFLTLHIMHYVCTFFSPSVSELICYTCRSVA